MFFRLVKEKRSIEMSFLSIVLIKHIFEATFSNEVISPRNVVETFKYKSKHEFFNCTVETSFEFISFVRDKNDLDTGDGPYFRTYSEFIEFVLSSTPSIGKTFLGTVFFRVESTYSSLFNFI